FEVPLLGGAQVVQAKTLQGIGDKPGRLDCVVANFTNAVSAGLEPRQGGIHLPEQGRQLKIRAGRGNRRRDSVAALHELFPHHKIEINAQGNLLSCPRTGASKLKSNLFIIALLVDKSGPTGMPAITAPRINRMTRSIQLGRSQVGTKKLRPLCQVLAV